MALKYFTRDMLGVRIGTMFKILVSPITTPSSLMSNYHRIYTVIDKTIVDLTNLQDSTTKEKDYYKLKLNNAKYFLGKGHVKMASEEVWSILYKVHRAECMLLYRLTGDKGPSDIGTLYGLPNDVLIKIFEQLQADTKREYDPSAMSKTLMEAIKPKAQPPVMYDEIMVEMLV